MDRADTPRPWRAPTVMIGLGAVLAFFNVLLLGWGVSVWGSGALATGLVSVALIVPVFCFRHFVQDKGVFPASMYDTRATGQGPAAPPEKRAGILPYLALVGGVVTLVVGQVLAAAAR